MKNVKKIVSALLVMIFIISTAGVKNANAAGFGGANSYSYTWTERSGFLWLNKDTYKAKATYSSSCIVLLENLSGTKYWGNYKNAQKTAQSMQIGISKQITVSKTTSVGVTGSIGLKVPVKAAEVSGSIGGSYTNSKTYSKTVGTSSAYTINTSSKNGYYAVTHAANCDIYSVKITKNGCSYSSGSLVRFASANGYEKLWYKSTAF